MQTEQEEWVIGDALIHGNWQVFEKSEDQLRSTETPYFFPFDITGFLKLVDFDRVGKKTFHSYSLRN